MSNKRGKPVTHPRILNTKTGEIFNTYTEAAISCNGTRWGVMRSCNGLQRHHKGIKFVFIKSR